MRESEKRVIEQGGDECNGKPEALSDGKEVCHQNEGRSRQPPGSGSGMKWSVDCSPDGRRCWEVEAVGVDV